MPKRKREGDLASDDSKRRKQKEKRRNKKVSVAKMIELTVKTLDSQNHSFSVPDDFTVKQLKERIAESISFPVESQRLIYCGRVLQDEKTLAEYDVNGKVIHLVQRPPPQVGRQNGNQSSGRPASGQSRRTNHGFRQPRVDANAMYLGAMAFPADLMDAQGIQAPPSSNVLSTSRVQLARTMLFGASDVLSRLERRQSTQEETTETAPGEDDANNTSSSTSTSFTVTDNVTNVSLPSDSAHDQQNTASVSATHVIGFPNITIVRGAGPSGQQSSIQTSGNTGSDRSASGQDNSAQDQPATSENASTSEQPAAGGSSTDNSSGTSGTSGRETLRTNAMGELLAVMTHIQGRLAPFAQQYQRLMSEDPTFEDNAAAQESQRIFSGVSEIFHYLSHAYHAMSDIMCDFSQTPPRNLRCRPVLIQHSAVLQAGIPIQAQINVMTNRGNDGRSRQTASSQTNISTTAATTNTNDTATASTPAPVSTEEQAEPARRGPPRVTVAQEATLRIAIPVVAPSQQQQQPQPSQQQEQRQPSQQQQEEQQQPPPQPPPPPRANRSTEGGNIPQPTFHITPGNVEFFMEVGPSSITIDSLEATVVTNNSNGGTGGSGGADANGIGAFPWGGATPPEFIQNLVHALGNHMIGRMGGTPSNGSNTTTAGTAPASAASNGGQNSQARGNTATYPTTATQTRSTSRPHVQFAPAAVQSFGSNYFDPFLPCNSHHIRGRRRATTQSNSQQATQQQPQQPQPQQPPASESATQEAASTAADGPTQESSRHSTPSTSAPTATAATSSGVRGLFGQLPGFPLELAQFQLQIPGSPLVRFPTLMPLIQNFPVFTQNAFMRALLGGASMYEVLATFPENIYVEGRSTFMDFMMLLARHLSLNDIVLLALGPTNINRLRPHLQEFIRQRILKGEAATKENITVAVHKLLQELRPYITSLAQVKVKDELDIVLSVNQYHKIKLPELINIIMSPDREADFSIEFRKWFIRYGREVASILKYCCVDGFPGLEEVLKGYMRNMMAGIQTDISEWTLGTTLDHLRSYFDGLQVPIEDIQPFLVYRISSLPSSLAQSAAQVNGVSSTELQVERSQEAEPMETDSVTPTVNGSLNLETSSCSESDHVQSPTNPVMDSDTLPDVVLGSESWHNVLPSDWVPIITRDTQRQKKQNSQQQFSDAYLSGMPSKRRKIVTNERMHGNGSQVLTEGVRQAVNRSGVRAVPDAETAGEDLELQAAYREQMRYTFEDNVAASTDVTQERFPDTKKYFEK